MKTKCTSKFIYYCFSHGDFMIQNNQNRTYYKNNCDTEFVTEVLFIDNTYQILKLKTEIETHFKNIGYTFNFEFLIRFLNNSLYDT